MLCLDLPCVIDNKLFQYDYIYGGTGRSTSTLKIRPHSLKELNQVIAIFN